MFVELTPEIVQWLNNPVFTFDISPFSSPVKSNNTKLWCQVKNVATITGKQGSPFTRSQSMKEGKCFFFLFIPRPKIKATIHLTNWTEIKFLVTISTPNQMELTTYVYHMFGKLHTIIILTQYSINQCVKVYNKYIMISLSTK